MQVLPATAHGRRPYHGGTRPTPYLFLLPYLVVFVLFRFGPVVGGFLTSFTSWSIVGAPRFVGLANYAALARDPLFYTSVRNTFYFLVLTAPALIGLGFVLALVLNRPLAGRGAARVLIFAPYAMMSAVVGILWTWILDSNFGLLNYYLAKVHLGPIPWLSSDAAAMPAIALTTVWWTVGYNMVIFLAGLQDIPPQLEESARVDGAGPWQILWFVTIPVLRPTTFVVVMLTIINTFQVFDQVYVMTGGGPGTATLTLVQYLFFQAFQTFKLGYGSAIAYITFALLLAMAWLQQRLLPSEASL
ncbi:MAG TPA: sugar ABC transporter permease [bacterium]|nr:sugar ABC transporter permease [bacterium]